MEAGQNGESWLNPTSQVDHLKSKGVKFDLMSESEAVSYLSENSSYYRIRAYRKNFPKVDAGPRKGEYANLDFGMLVDLSIIDMLLRYEMLPMALDVEHFAKIRLLLKFESVGEDSRSPVSDFIASYDRVDFGGKVSNAVKNEMDKGKKSSYVNGILLKHSKYDFPVWSLLELISFGTFVYFYKFCAERFDDKAMLDEFYLLQSVRALRNACAHNNCVLNEMGGRTSKFKARSAVSRAIGEVKGIGQSQRKSKLSNDRMQQIATTLYMHRELASKGVHESRAESLARFVERMNRHSEYYKGNSLVISGFDFITKLVDGWFGDPKAVGNAKDAAAVKKMPCKAKACGVKCSHNEKR